MNEIAMRLASRIFDQKLIGNQYRSAFIEAMVEPYLEPRGWRYAGDGWSGWDFEHREGSRLEIKQSAAQQTWSGARQLVTRGAFDIAPRTGYYYEGGTKYEPTHRLRIRRRALPDHGRHARSRDRLTGT